MKIHKEKTIKKIILVLLIMILGSTLIELGTNIKSLYMKNQNKKQEHRMRGKGIHSKSIFVQLIVFSLLTSLVPILIISIFLFYKLDNTAQTETKDYHEQITSQYMKNIGEKLKKYKT